MSKRPPYSLFSPLGGGRIAGTSGQNGSFLRFDDIVSVDAVFAAWMKFRRGKRLRPDVMEYECNLEANLFTLHEILITGTYRHSSYTPFQICDPKLRSIHKATVRDRVVHQIIVSSIEPLFERRFIYDSFSCRKGKGTHAAVKRLRTMLNQASSNNTRTVYALKCDIRKFFASVDHAVLRDLLKRRIADPKIPSLINEVIDSHSISPGKGMPLGNLTSQLIANIYLHELDWFVKHTLNQKHYTRYCDDFIILSRNREELLKLVPQLEEFLRDNLALSLHPSKVTVHSWHQGIDFLGYVLKPHCTVLRTKTKNRMLARVNQNNLTSYEGLCRHASSYRTHQLIIIKALTSQP